MCLRHCWPNIIRSGQMRNFYARYLHSSYVVSWLDRDSSVASKSTYKRLRWSWVYFESSEQIKWIESRTTVDKIMQSKTCRLLNYAIKVVTKSSHIATCLHCYLPNTCVECEINDQSRCVSNRVLLMKCCGKWFNKSSALINNTLRFLGHQVWFFAANATQSKFRLCLQKAFPSIALILIYCHIDLCCAMFRVGNLLLALEFFKSLQIRGSHVQSTRKRKRKSEEFSSFKAFLKKQFKILKDDFLVNYVRPEMFEFGIKFCVLSIE